jgi:hypothetical protein
VDRPTRPTPLDDVLTRTGRESPLVRAAIRRRRAERAFEEYVREMAHRWHLVPGQDGSGADRDPPPGVDPVPE